MIVGNWAFSWVQVIAHNKKTLAVGWAAISAFILFGALSPYVNQGVAVFGELSLLVLALVVMATLVGYFLESPKMAVLQLALSIYVGLMVVGALGWAGVVPAKEALLGFVILMTVVSSNLIHLLSTLSREMARGLFQYDAIAEAIKLNHTPILLSNLTTALGFIAAAMVQPMLTELALMVAVGSLFSYLMVLTWLPLILLSWLLEFRVGNSNDRQGLKPLTDWLQQNHLRKRFIIIVAAILLVATVIVNVRFETEIFNLWPEMLTIAVLFLVMFWLHFGFFKLALLNVAATYFALFLALSMFVVLFEQNTHLWVLWMIPLGLVVDDGIHFFSRYARAKKGVFNDANSASKYAMASVGRAIWITSWVLLAGLVVLLMSSTAFIWQAAMLTLIAVLVATFVFLTLIPSLLISHK